MKGSVTVVRKDKRGIINPALIAAITAIRHTEYLVICDCGLPIPASGANVIDISLAAGVPGFIETLRLVCGEMAIEGAVIACEMPENSDLFRETAQILTDVPMRKVPHEELKQMTGQAKCFVITGEATPYANVILVGGVSF